MSTKTKSRRAAAIASVMALFIFLVGLTACMQAASGTARPATDAAPDYAATEVYLQQQGALLENELQAAYVEQTRVAKEAAELTERIISQALADNLETLIEINDLQLAAVKEAIAADATLRRFVNEQEREAAKMIPTATHVAIQATQADTTRRNMWSIFGISVSLSGVILLGSWRWMLNRNNETQIEIEKEDAAAKRRKEFSEVRKVGDKHLHLHYTANTLEVQSLGDMLPDEVYKPQTEPTMKSRGRITSIGPNASSKDKVLFYLYTCQNYVKNATAEEELTPNQLPPTRKLKDSDGGKKGVFHPNKQTAIRALLVDLGLLKLYKQQHYTTHKNIAQAIALLENGTVTLPDTVTF